MPRPISQYYHITITFHYKPENWYKELKHARIHFMLSWTWPQPVKTACLKNVYIHTKNRLPFLTYYLLNSNVLFYKYIHLFKKQVYLTHLQFFKKFQKPLYQILMQYLKAKVHCWLPKIGITFLLHFKIW